MKFVLFILLFVFITTQVLAKGESRTVYLSQDEMVKLNGGQSIYRWYGEDKPYGEGSEFMDEVRPPKKNVAEENAKIYLNQKSTLDKIYTMLADLHIKFMGLERYNQIYDPTSEGEVAKQKKWAEEKLRELKKEYREELRKGIEAIK